MSYAQVASVQPSQATMIANPQQILNPTIPSNTSFSLFNWKNTSSSLKNRPFMGRSTPLSSSPNSLFLDTCSHKVPDQFIIDKFKNELIGVAFNPNMGFLELVFASKELFEKYLDEPFEYNSKSIYLSPPKGHPRKKLILHLHGLPILDKETLSSAISSALSEFGSIIEVAPVVISGTNLLTPKWDVVIEPNHEKNIPTSLTIFDNVAVLTWVNSPKVCLHCKEDGHLHSECPKRSLPRRPIANLATITLDTNTNSTNRSPSTKSSSSTNNSKSNPHKTQNISLDSMQKNQSTQQSSSTESQTIPNSQSPTTTSLYTIDSPNYHTVNNTDANMQIDTTVSQSSDIHSSIHAPSATSNNNNPKDVDSGYTPNDSSYSENMSIDSVDPSTFSGPNYNPSDPTPFSTISKKYNLRSISN